MDDIRRQAHLSGQDLKLLNFKKNSDRFVFRKFYRSGLRSHIFEVLKKDDVDQESIGVVEDGIRVFPRAKPIKIFRIFRRRFGSKAEIFQEIGRYNLLLDYIGVQFIAPSEEFIADYRDQTGTGRIILCGLQEYVAGQMIDPWRLLGPQTIASLLSNMGHELPLDKRIERAMNQIAAFVTGIRRLMAETGYIPDLAGVGNLILTPAGGIKLVDINNIVLVNHDKYIHMDDKGYPTCDVSVQVLSMIEKKILGRTDIDSEPVYQLFLKPDRIQQVKKIEQAFFRQLKAANR
ncbi:MAG: hypothetical protein CSA29_03810 [Desulfobacterales bacterium]|nr:MAG: hypothetical protein CSA29_03810 [Desulfobacterales bacterium]